MTVIWLKYDFRKVVVVGGGGELVWIAFLLINISNQFLIM